MLPSGILQSSRMMLAVDEALMPNLSSFFPRERPGCGMGIRNALIPYIHREVEEIKKAKLYNLMFMFLVRGCVVPCV